MVDTKLTDKILVELKKGPKTRHELKNTLNTPRTTIYDVLKVLIKEEKVEKYPVFKTEQGRGRPPVVFAIKKPKSSQDE
jgi:predicted ArsR family transcriptional regulator